MPSYHMPLQQGTKLMIAMYTFYLEVYSAVHLICLIEKSPKLGNARIPWLGYVQLRNYQHRFKVHYIADKNKVIRFVLSCLWYVEGSDGRP